MSYDDAEVAGPHKPSLRVKEHAHAPMEPRPEYNRYAASSQKAARAAVPGPFASGWQDRPVQQIKVKWSDRRYSHLAYLSAAASAVKR